jgi:hypothetical protein
LFDPDFMSVPMLKVCVPCLCLAFLLPVEATPLTATLSAEPNEISAGQTTTLSWIVPAGAIGFLSPHLGLITGPSSSSVQLKPSSSIDYVLIIESRDVPPVLISRHVRVSGTKGAENDWHLVEPLAVRIEYVLRRASLARLSQRVQQVLQDDDHFDVRAVEIDGRYIAGTKFSETSIPIDPEERPRKLRRIAYRVSLGSVDRELHVEITSEIDWRIPILEMWYPEAADSKLYSRVLSNLREALSNNQK